MKNELFVARETLFDSAVMDKLSIISITWITQS